MKTTARFFALVACAFLTGCFGGGSSSPGNPGLPAATGQHLNNDVVRVGDKITIQLSGVPDNGYFNEKQIPVSGDFTLPLLTQSFHAEGKTTSQIAEEITTAYKSQHIYTNPVVTVLEEERFVTMGGDVRSPSNVPYRPDLTLIGAINNCGGFTEFANRRSVRVIRGKQVFYIDCIKAAATPGSDPALFPGDQVYVPRTVF